MRGLDIRYLEIEDRRRMVELRPLRRCQHQANAAAIKEGQTPRSEQQFESENVTVELDGAACVVYVDGNLPDLRNADSAGGGAGSHGFILMLDLLSTIRGLGHSINSLSANNPRPVRRLKAREQPL